MPNVTYVITFRLRPGCEAAFLHLLNPVLDAMRHERTFVNAILHRDPEDGSRLMLYETWADAEDVATVQIDRPYRKAFWESLPDLLSAPREIAAWEAMRTDLAIRI